MFKTFNQIAKTWQTILLSTTVWSKPYKESPVCFANVVSEKRKDSFVQERSGHRIQYEVDEAPSRSSLRIGVPP